MKNTVIYLISFAILLPALWWLFNNKKDSKGNEGRTNPVMPVLINLDSLVQAYPRCPEEAEVRKLSGFDLSYCEENEQASWVIYVLTKDEVNGDVKRMNNFREDDMISSGSATLSDYKGSGYDRGHLAPAADMKWSEQSMSESFLMSNMSPQAPSFNRGIWKKLEEYIRDLALVNDSLILISGPVFKDNQGVIGANEVTIPGYFYKVIVDISWPESKAGAWLLKNEKSDLPLNSYAISIDSLENFCGCDFFYLMKEMEVLEAENGFLKTINQ